MGYAEPMMVASTVRGWHHGRYRAMRSVRARELLTELMPALLEALARTAQPDAAFVRFDRFLSQLPSGVQIFSLFSANPNLLGLVADVMGDAPRLADLLSQHTNLLDSVLSPDFLVPPPNGAALAADLERALGQARDFQDVLDVLRRWKGEREFQVGVQMLRGLLPIAAAGAALADIAEATLVALQPRVEDEFARQHGHVPGGAFSVTAFGKLGGREMTVTSDLDLIFLWHAPGDVETSDGAKPLPVSLYYQRLAQRFINAISAPTGEGKLYELDLRLRPSGNKGPLATNLEGFVAYQRDNAWTWEHLALTRARPLTGPPELRGKIAAAIRTALARPRDAGKLTSDVAEMRALMAREHAARQPWDIKHWRGGLVDVEFIAQYLQLRHSASHPQMLRPNTADALHGAMTSDVLSREQGAALLDALRLWQIVQGLLRLTVEGDFVPADAPAGLRNALARAAGEVDFPALEAKMRERSREVLAIFGALIPAAASPLAAKLPQT
jgi:[glutamine synthetase] adenylyltransferase / [glutamine synthetase]-adenylyl-L-tyrosine phosphorylase